MKETALHELDDRARKLAANARKALAQGDAAYAVEVLGEVMAAAPGCAELRRPWWEALRAQRGGGLWGKLRGALSGGGGNAAPGGDPLAAFTAATKRVERAPDDVAGLRAMAAAAKALGWGATECFAWEAVVELDPSRKRDALAWVEALQRQGKFDAAEQALATLRQRYPHDGDVQAAQRELGVARTMREGGWEADGDFRGKLRD